MSRRVTRPGQFSSAKHPELELLGQDIESCATGNCGRIIRGDLQFILTAEAGPSSSSGSRHKGRKILPLSLSLSLFSTSLFPAIAAFCSALSPATWPDIIRTNLGHGRGRRLPLLPNANTLHTYHCVRRLETGRWRGSAGLGRGSRGGAAVYWISED